MMDNKVGIFSISLDFELHWGIFDNHSLDEKIQNLDATRKVIPEMLESFKDHEVEATWASVGMLFNDSLEDIRKNYPKELPSYTDTKLSSYTFLENQDPKGLDQYYIATDLLELIKNTPGQEIGTHTYSHYYALEEGQKEEQFHADLSKCQELAKNFDIELESIVFPRHQVNPAYFKTCINNGIRLIRTNPKKWPWMMENNNKITAKVARTLDCYLPLFNNNVSLEKLLKSDTEYVIVPASRFLRPATRFSFLNKMRIQRIKKEMTQAAIRKEYYHLWWHPHNFGDNPHQAMRELNDILKHYKKLKTTHGMTSLNMKNLKTLIN